MWDPAGSVWRKRRLCQLVRVVLVPLQAWLPGRVPYWFRGDCVHRHDDNRCPSSHTRLVCLCRAADCVVCLQDSVLVWQLKPKVSTFSSSCSAHWSWCCWWQLDYCTTVTTGGRSRCIARAPETSPTPTTTGTVTTVAPQSCRRCPRRHRPPGSSGTAGLGWRSAAQLWNCRCCASARWWWRDTRSRRREGRSEGTGLMIWKLSVN